MGAVRPDRDQPPAATFDRAAGYNPPMRVFLGTLAAVLVLLAGTAAGAAGQPSPQAALQQALNPLMGDMGSSSGAYVVDLNTGQVLYSVAADTGRLPASVEKIYTTSTALLRLGPTATFATSILGVGSQNPEGVWDGTLYLRGGGDPTLGSVGFDHAWYGTGATLRTLVGALIRATGIKAIQGRIVADESYFDIAARNAGDRLRAQPGGGGTARRADVRPRVHQRPGHRLSGAPGPVRRPAARQHPAGLRGEGGGYAGVGRPHAAGRHASCLGAVTAALDPDRAHQHAVRQLPRRDAAEGHRRPARWGRHDGRRRSRGPG